MITRSVWSALIALTAFAAAGHSQQSPETAAMRQAVAQHIAQWVTTTPELRAYRVLLDTRPVNAWYDTRLHDEIESPRVRASGEVEQLANAMRSAIATDSDLFSCRVTRAGTPCEYGPNNVMLVRIGEPRQVLDSATVTYSLGSVVKRGRGRPTSTMYVAWLKRSASGWVVTTARQAPKGGTNR